MTNLVSRLANGNFFQIPLFLALTVGVPFGIFKLLFGILALRFALENHVTYLAYIGIAVVWASLDTIMNLLTAIFDLYTLAEIGRFLGMLGYLVLNAQSRLDTIVTAKLEIGGIQNDKVDSGSYRNCHDISS